MKGWLRHLRLSSSPRKCRMVTQHYTNVARELHSTTDIREVIKISKDPKMIKAVLFGIDSRSGESFPSLPVTFQGNAINIQFPGNGASYQGTLSMDGNSITGTFSQGVRGRPSPSGAQRGETQTWEIPVASRKRKTMATDAAPEIHRWSVDLNLIADPHDANQNEPGAAVADAAVEEPGILVLVLDFITSRARRDGSEPTSSIL